jgi:phycocyanobilin:ferredoxin oxidoreductase
VNAVPLMAAGASSFAARLAAEPGCAPLPAPDISDPRDAKMDVAEPRWDNTLLRAQRFRRAHVELFSVPGRVCVLHVCVFPHLDDPAPIFGFDMIAGPARVTGLFLDLSPVTAAPPAPRLRDFARPDSLDNFAAPRALPDWGDIFSPDVLAIRPADGDEIVRAIALARRALEGVLALPRRRDGPSRDIAAGQNRYCLGQLRNTHTPRMLAGFIGAAPARRFIAEVLFPLAPDLADHPADTPGAHMRVAEASAA